jgi:hypothetical protein
MKKIEAEVYWDGKTVEVINLPFVLEQLRENFQPGYLDISIQLPWQWRTSSAMGYFFGEVGVKCLAGLKEAGYDVSSKEAAVDFIMEQLPSGRWVEEVRRFGKPVKTSVRSIASLSRAELHELTEEMIRFLSEWFHITCGTPEEYKQKWQLKSTK